VNSTDELVPLSQAQAMAATLDAAGIDHRLDVLPGPRHAVVGLVGAAVVVLRRRAGAGGS